jgi:hypothetical protein
MNVRSIPVLIAIGAGLSLSYGLLAPQQTLAQSACPQITWGHPTVMCPTEPDPPHPDDGDPNGFI